MCMRTSFLSIGLAAGWLAVFLSPSGYGGQEQGEAPSNPAVIPVPRGDADWWMPRHEKILQMKDKESVNLVFIGDSITHGWENLGREVWNQYYASRGAANLGFSGDKTENVLWRIENGEIDGLNPKLVVLMIGTNNRNDAKAVAAGLKAIVDALRSKLPDSKILVLGIFPRGKYEDRENREIQESGANQLWTRNDEVNAIVSGLADGQHVYFLNINEHFLHNGLVPRQYMPDFLHPNKSGYEVWASAMEPTIVSLLEQK